MKDMSNIIEVRLRHVVDEEPCWEAKAPIMARAHSATDANRVAFALLVAPVWEVRWNWRGSLQGHYISDLGILREGQKEGQED